MDKGGGGSNAYPQNVDKKDVLFFLTPPLATSCESLGSILGLQLAESDVTLHFKLSLNFKLKVKYFSIF